ncbi:CAMK family protein kinase [Histomonas meleagridis]|uniref:CAMK family protein kinase n=1 Tax=Histomonas meleagridis TaxID=135588 RepID=UPI003559FCDB|nr:CAMK family protein kinase [Histomonas meleagridis]KAH0796338.1 CAMK family protein kinase [Histomonas meleagridis]
MDYLLEHGFLENDTMYLLSRLASQYMFSQNTIIRYHVQKLINNLPPEIRQCNDYCFFFKRQNISAPRKNTKVNSKSERPKLQGTIKLKVPPKESIASRLTPRFVATFHSDLSPIKYIFANNDNTMCITINEANRVRWLSIYNENGSLVQPSQYRSHILRVQISSASILSSTHYLLGFENGAIESYEFKNEKKTVIIPPQNNNIHFTNIRPVDRNSTFLCSSSDRSISLIDTRSPESRSTLQYRQISDISDICFWSDRPLAAIGFSEGLVSFVDIRMFVPMYMTETSAVVNLSPAATNDDSSCAFFVQSDQKVELIKEPFTKVCLTCNGRFTQILPYFGGVLAIDDRAVTYIDSCEDRPSVTLYDGQKLICMRNDKILGMQPGNFQSLHMHQGKVTTAVHCGKVFVSGDTLGYTNVWSI